MKKTYLASLFALLTLQVAVALPVFAQAAPAAPAAPPLDLGLQYGQSTGLGQTDVRITVSNVIKVILGLLGTIALVLIFYAGFLWMTAAGDDEQIGKAKNIISAAVIGLVVILSAYSITTFVFNQLVPATGGTLAQ